MSTVQKHEIRQVPVQVVSKVEHAEAVLFYQAQDGKQVSLPVEPAFFPGGDAFLLLFALLIEFSERLAQVSERAGFVCLDNRDEDLVSVGTHHVHIPLSAELKRLLAVRKSCFP